MDDCSGATAVEYVVVAAGIALVLVTVLAAVSGGVLSLFQSIKALF